MNYQYPGKQTEGLSLPTEEAVVREWCVMFLNPAIRLLERLAHVLGDRTFSWVDFPYLSQWMQNRKAPVAGEIFEAFPAVQDEYLSTLDRLAELQGKFRALQTYVLSSPELARGLRTVLLVKAPKPAAKTVSIEQGGRTVLTEMFDRVQRSDEKFLQSLAQRMCQHLIGAQPGRASGHDGFIDTQIAPVVLPGFGGRRDILAMAGDLRSAVEESQQGCNDFRLYLEEFRHHLCLRHSTFYDDE